MGDFSADKIQDREKDQEARIVERITTIIEKDICCYDKAKRLAIKVAESLLEKVRHG